MLFGWYNLHALGLSPPLQLSNVLAQLMAARQTCFGMVMHITLNGHSPFLATLGPI